VEILEIALKDHFVVLPGHSIDSSGSFAFERVECHLERVDVDLMEKRGEPLLFFLSHLATAEALALVAIDIRKKRKGEVRPAPSETRHP
jgi:hypothetical protein